MSITAHTIENYQVAISNGRHHIIADEPVSAGGDDIGPGPYDYLLAGLAACTIITLHMYAGRKNWDLRRVDLTAEHRKVAADDCEECKTSGRSKVDVIDIDLTFEGDLDPAQIDRLMQIAKRCPVHRTLISETVIHTKLAEETIRWPAS